jgi:hypothetical protein
MCMLLLALYATSFGQSADKIDQFASLPNKFFARVNNKIEKLDDNLTRQTEKYLQRLAKQEAKIKKRLSRIDSNANQLFANGNADYEKLIARIKMPGTNTALSGGEYIPMLDSLGTGFSFLSASSGIAGDKLPLVEKAKQSLGAVQQLQSRMQSAETVRRFIRERRQQLKEALGRYGKLPPALSRQMQQFSKEVYYYSQQLREYREMLNDPGKLTRKAFSMLNKLPAFHNFFAKHSQLASMFSLPGEDPLNVQSLYGLQTRVDIQSLIQQRIGNDPAARQQLQLNLQEAQHHMQKLKDKVLANVAKGGSGDEDLDFKPNNQKTKTFKQRLEISLNLQSQKPNGWFPVTSDFGLSLGYKLNDRSVMGLGASYKMGWGQSIRNIDITHQGIGLRSFIDWKIKGSFWLSGGYEQNYHHEFRRIEQLKQLSAWQQSGLVGLSKILSIKTKLLKQTKVQLLWDFLGSQQTPRSNPIIFRVGYNLK